MPAPTARAACALVCLLACLTAIGGCTTARALRRNTIQQAETVTDIHQQQVLDNLAKFIHDPYAVPSFAVATAGTNRLTDTGTGVLGLSWNGTAFTGASTMFTGQRANQGTWTTTAINDPRKLELMRCAYQRAIATCGLGYGESTSCPDCKKRFNKFYSGWENPYEIKDGKRCYKCENGVPIDTVSEPYDDPCVCREKACEEQTVVEELPPCHACEGAVVAGECTASPGSGKVNSNCLGGPCWFCCGNKDCVPECCSCVGHYCGTYVWVPQGPGRNELAKLTLAIMDFAVNEPAARPRKTVYAMLDADGDLTTLQKASMVVTTDVSVDELSRSAVKPDIDNATATTKAVLSNRMELSEVEKSIEGTLSQLREQANEEGTGVRSVPSAMKLLSPDIDISQQALSDAAKDLTEAGKPQAVDRVKTLMKLFGQRDRLLMEKAVRNEEMIRRLPPVESIQPRASSGAGGGGLLRLQQLLETVD